MKPRKSVVFATFGVLTVLALVTLDGTIRLATLVFLAGYLLKTLLLTLNRD